jgi:preprotein translocase subunit SecF
MRLFQNASYTFIERRKTAYVVSAVALLAGIAAMVFNVATLGTWLRYGVDFTGGSLVQVQFQDDVSVEELRAALGGVDITRFGDVDLHEFVIRAPVDEESSISEVADDGLIGCDDRAPRHDRAQRVFRVTTADTFPVAARRNALATRRERPVLAGACRHETPIRRLAHRT